MLSTQAQNQGSRDQRGFASMTSAQQKKIASMGGKAVSQDRQHMAEIGRRGGKASHGSNRQASVA
ncbi:MAG: KGG domain-containing protein [bacterium]